MNPNKPDIEGLSDYVGVRGAHPNLQAFEYRLNCERCFINRKRVMMDTLFWISFVGFFASFWVWIYTIAGQGFKSFQTNRIVQISTLNLWFWSMLMLFLNW